MTLSLRRFVLHDYPSSLAVLFIVTYWLLALLLPEIDETLLAHGETLVGYDLLLGLLWTALCSTVIAWRLTRVVHLFKNGRVAQARVTIVWVPPWPSKAPFTYNFAFEHEGRRVRSHIHVFRMWRKPALKRGQIVQALYDPAQPTDAVILDLFRTPPQ